MFKKHVKKGPGDFRFYGGVRCRLKQRLSDTLIPGTLNESWQNEWIILSNLLRRNCLRHAATASGAFAAHLRAIVSCKVWFSPSVCKSWNATMLGAHCAQTASGSDSKFWGATFCSSRSARYPVTAI